MGNMKKINLCEAVLKREKVSADPHRVRAGGSFCWGWVRTNKWSRPPKLNIARCAVSPRLILKEDGAPSVVAPCYRNFFLTLSDR